MTDPETIEQRLRDYRPTNEWGDPVHHTICDEAADLIASLRAERDALREALRRPDDSDGGLIEAIEKAGFECDGGPLRNFVPWIAMAERLHQRREVSELLADKCTALRAEREVLREALRSAIGAMETLDHPEDYGALKKARAALAAGEGGR